MQSHTFTPTMCYRNRRADATDYPSTWQRIARSGGATMCSISHFIITEQIKPFTCQTPRDATGRTAMRSLSASCNARNVDSQSTHVIFTVERPTRLPHAVEELRTLRKIIRFLQIHRPKRPKVESRLVRVQHKTVFSCARRQASGGRWRWSPPPPAAQYAPPAARPKEQPSDPVRDLAGKINRHRDENIQIYVVYHEYYGNKTQCLRIRFIFEHVT